MIADLKKGQRIRVLIEGVVDNPLSASGGYVTLDLPNGSRATLSRNTPNVEVIPDPIVTGSRVFTSGGHAGKVLAQDGDYSWVKLDNKAAATYFTSELRPADPKGC